MKLVADKKFWLLLLLCCAVLAVPQLIRLYFVDGLWIGEDSYYNINIAEKIAIGTGLSFFDSLSFGGREFIGSYGMPLLLGVNIDIMSRVLPFVLGILCFALFYFFVRRACGDDIGFLSGLLLIFSPPFIYLFSTVNEFGIAIVLFLSGLVFLFKKKSFLAWLFFFLIILFSVKAAIVVWVLALVYYLKERDSGFAYLSVLYLVFFVVRYYRLFFSGLPEFLVFDYREEFFSGLFSTIFSDFGGYFGFGFFYFVLGVIGIALVWSQKYRYVFAYLVLGLLLCLTYYVGFLVYFINFAVVVLCAYGLVGLYGIAWKSDLFKFLVILVLVCGIVFSSASFISRVGFFPPSRDEGVIMSFLKAEDGDYTVFSHYSRGKFINYAGKKNVMDNDFLYAPELNERWADSEKLFHSNYRTEIDHFIKKYDILYIWMDDELKMRIWGRSDVELLELLKRDTKGFIKVYSKGNTELWGLMQENGA